jgi:hypothetical protein
LLRRRKRVRYSHQPQRRGVLKRGPHPPLSRRSPLKRHQLNNLKIKGMRRWRLRRRYRKMFRLPLQKIQLARSNSNNRLRKQRDHKHLRVRLPPHLPLKRRWKLWLLGRSELPCLWLLWYRINLHLRSRNKRQVEIKK